MNRDPKSHRPHTPLLFVLLGVAMFATRVLEPVVTTALVAAIAGTRIFVR